MVYVTVFFSGMAVMALELAASRMESAANPCIRRLINAGLDRFGRYERGVGTAVFTDDRAPVEMYTDIIIRKFSRSL